MSAPRERPILFSGPMVRALLDGRKTMTRLIVKPQPPEGHAFHGITVCSTDARDVGSAVWAQGPFPLLRDVHRVRCPYGQPGDRLFVREAWQYADWTDDGYPWIRYRADDAKRCIETGITEEWSERLSDIWTALSADENYSIDQRAADRRWRSSIHMPRWASRITLEVTGVRVERLQTISASDAWAEGIPASPDVNPIHEYAELWDSINSPKPPQHIRRRKGRGKPTEQWDEAHPPKSNPNSWDANPWVWVVSFRRIAEEWLAADTNDEEFEVTK